MAIRIRRLRLSDYDSLVELFRLTGMEPRVKGRDSRTAISVQLRSNGNVYLGAFDGDRLIGAVFGNHDSRKGWINRLAVDPEYRRRGVAARLVRAAEGGLRKKGIQMFGALIEPENAASEAVFRSLGYDVDPILYARRKLRADI